MFVSWLTWAPPNSMKNKTYHYSRLGIVDYSLDPLQKSITTLCLKFQMEPCQNCWHFSVMIPKVHSSDIVILNPFKSSFRRKWKVIILTSHDAQISQLAKLGQRLISRLTKKSLKIVLNNQCQLGQWADILSLTIKKY